MTKRMQGMLFVFLPLFAVTQAISAEKDFHFPQNSAFVRLPMKVEANGPYVEAKVNGRGPFTFEVDTGAGTSPFASELAEEMGLDQAGVKADASAEIGLGDGLVVPLPVNFASFGGVWPLVGRRTYGAFGFAILRHFVVEFDYENKTLTLYDPERYKYSGPGTSFPATLEMDYDPQIEGTIMVAPGIEIPARFTLDTGAGGTVISAPIVKAHDLLKLVTRKVPIPRSKSLVDGVNGATFDSISGRIEALKFGNLTVREPLVALSTDTDGVFAMDDIGVNLGGNVLRHFKVIIDYPGSRVILEPNKRFQEPFLADASGLVLTAEGPQFHRVRVHGVVQGSPADVAGIKEGDTITAIDGKSTDKYALWEIQDLLKASDQERKLTINREGKTMTLPIKLHQLA